MENENERIKAAIAANIADLRKKAGMTQQDLADALSYTDKAVSKWERAESIPDVVILKRIADLFGVSLDYLLQEHSEAEALPLPPSHRHRKHVLITCICVFAVLLAATLAFVIVARAVSASRAGLIFLYAIPASAVVWLIFNSIWFSKKRNFLIVSVLMWSVLASIHVTAMIYGRFWFWMLYLLGIPGQVIILLWSGIGRRPRKK